MSIKSKSSLAERKIVKTVQLNTLFVNKIFAIHFSMNVIENVLKMIFARNSNERKRELKLEKIDGQKKREEGEE